MLVAQGRGRGPLGKPAAGQAAGQAVGKCQVLLQQSRGGRANTGGREVKEALMAYSSLSLLWLETEVGGKGGAVKQLHRSHDARTVIVK